MLYHIVSDNYLLLLWSWIEGGRRYRNAFILLEYFFKAVEIAPQNNSNKKDTAVECLSKVRSLLSIRHEQ